MFTLIIVCFHVVVLAFKPLFSFIQSSNEQLTDERIECLLWYHCDLRSWPQVINMH